MPWKHDGKIAMQFNWGAVNYDAVKIVYADNSHPYTADGDETNAINKVYYFPDGFNPATLTDSNLDDYLFWHRYWEEPPSEHQLIRGTTGALIEFIPSANMTLNSFGIFEDNGDTTKTNDNFRIFNEAGIQIAYLGTGTIISNEIEKYGLTGHIRTGNMGSIPLEADKKYYFLFQSDSFNSSNAIPAKFNNEIGVIRETYNAQSDTQTATYNLTGLNNNLGFIGGTTAISKFITANSGDYMTWNTNDSDASIYSRFNANTLYVRSDNLTGLTGDFIGKIGTGTIYESVLEVDNGNMFAWKGYNNHLSNDMLYEKNNVLDSTKYIANVDNISKVLSANINSNFVYRPANYDGILNIGSIYKKNFNSVGTFNTSRQNDDAFAELLLNSGFSAHGNEIFTTTGFCGWGYNSLLTRTNIGSVQFTTLTPINVTAVTNKVDDGLYYLSGTWSDPINVRGVYYYEQSSDSFKLLFNANYGADLNNVTRFVTSATIASHCTEYNVTAVVNELNPNLMMLASAYVQPEFTQTTYNDTRYYLEINSNEVDTTKRE